MAQLWRNCTAYRKTLQPEFHTHNTAASEGQSLCENGKGGSETSAGTDANGVVLFFKVPNFWESTVRDYTSPS